MFSSFFTYSNPFRLPRLLGGDSGSFVNIKPVTVHHIETSQAKSSRTLKHLIKLNHVNHAIVYHHLQFHNHMPHILGSAYLLGAKPDHLRAIYDEEAKDLEAWKDSPGEVSDFDWRDFLGDRRYQRAYVDFFEDQLVLVGYDWHKVLEKFLFQGKEPLINALIGGLGHPLIHLGYAYEISSREIAMEALGLATTSYNFLHKYLDDPSYTKPCNNSSQSPLEILCRIRADKRFDNIFEIEGSDNIETLFQNHEAAVLEYWNTWQITDPTGDFEASQRAAAALLVASHKPGHYDFFIVHLLTTSHAVRILLPIIPRKYHVALIRQWWLLTIAVYVAQLRPEILLTRITDYDVKGKDWAWADKEATEGKFALDAHYVKAIRAMKEAARDWENDEGFYRKAAVRFAAEFEGWGGFGLSTMN